MATLDQCRTFDGSAWVTVDSMTYRAYAIGSSGVLGSTGVNVWGGNAYDPSEGHDETSYYDPSADSWGTCTATLLGGDAYNLRGAGGGIPN